jgi:hypothetical protein
MTNTPPWHPTRAIDRAVYHNDTRCPEGGAIPFRDRRPGDGGRDPCPHCAQFLIGPIVTRLLRGLTRSETVPERCPTCQSNRIAPAGHVIVSDGLVVVRRQYQCAACGGAFWARADADPARPNGQRE